MSAIQTEINKAVSIVLKGGVIAYPTEAVYGLGCDPFNQSAVERLLKLKNRAVDKGLILIAAAWELLEELVLPIDPERLALVQASWPGPYTWIFPASKTPSWIRGKHSSVAVRVTAHPIAKVLSQQFGKPLVSTSANREGDAPARDAAMVATLFGRDVDYIVPGPVGHLANPTVIRDAITGEVVRA
ncbi:MAG: threonylcarbamoyl-AMP synthase [Coxiellaceae bacterium]|nr:MAG: threonylcarbamoyl-AMP synthase [Coxiellaceae bacterium]